MIKSAVLASVLLSSVAYADDADTGASVVVSPPSVTVAITPPQDVPLPQPPPQNEAWSNVSHINGTPVPVGERNTYLYNFKKTNIQTNPIGWMLGYYQIAVSHAVSANIALSVEVAYQSAQDGNTSASQIAASAPIYFKRTFSGPFLEPGILVRNESTSFDDECAGGGCSSGNSVSFTAVEMMLGYAWMFDSGLNMSAAIGISKRIGGNADSDDCCDDSQLEPAGYFRVGYAF